MKDCLLRVTFLLLFSSTLSAQRTIVEIEKPQHAKSVAGVVNDPSGSALPGVTVEERSEDWKTVLRSTETDDQGRFQFSPRPRTVMYHLQFARSGFDWVRIKLQLEKKAAATIVVTMPLGA